MARQTYPQGQHTTVVVQGQPQVVVANQPQRGLLGELKSAGSSLMREGGKAATDVWRTVDPHGYQSHMQVQQMFATNNVVQLISRASGHSLQVVQVPDGTLVLDGKGAEGPQQQFYNTHWTMFRETGNVVRLHNNFNYIAIANGQAVVMFFPSGTQPSAETRFVFAEHQAFVSLESAKEVGRFVGVNLDGTLKSAMATGRMDNNAHFGVRLIYSPHIRTQ